MRKTLFFIAFALMVLVQLFVPLQMIWNSENIIRKNQVYLFEVQPIDPHDVFRGKYVTLGFKNDKIAVENPNEYQRGQEVYVFVDKWDNIAYLTDVSPNAPKDVSNYFKTKINYFTDNEIVVEMPFNRFYMNEEKSLDAERILQDTTLKAYAKVAVYQGEAVLQDVIVNQMSLKDFVKQYKNQKNKK